MKRRTNTVRSRHANGSSFSSSQNQHQLPCQSPVLK